jgi:prepilin-type N-terminal cleavage/methylation domain-containing protein
MARTLHRESGVTLIEILIAVSLLSLLSAGMLIAMRIGFNTMEKTDGRLVSNRRVSYARRIVEDEIAGYNYTIAVFHPQPGTSNVVAFSQWEPQTMRFVTSYSLADAWRGRRQIAMLQVIPGEQNRGVRLILNETPYTGPEQAGEMVESIDPDFAVHYAPVNASALSFVLADKLAYCRFSYLEPETQAPFQIWRPDWVQRFQLPLGVRIEMVPLDAASADLHVSTVTVAMHVNTTPGVVYADTP